MRARFALRSWAAGAGLALLLTPAAVPAAAQQLDRTVEVHGDEVTFAVRFRDAERRQRVLRFALPAEPYREARQGLPVLDDPATRARLDAPVRELVTDSRERWREQIAARLEALAGTLPERVELTWEFRDGKLSWRLQGRGVPRAELERHGERLAQQLERAGHRLNAKRQQRLASEARAARTAVLRRMNYVRDPDLSGLIRPDYAGLARAQAELLKPLAQAVAERAKPGERDWVALALAFLQSIPYDRLEARGAADGTGFAVPAQLLHLNRGDCDSKATALAALMRNLTPSVQTAIVLLPGHAVIAADLPVQANDRTIRLAGREFVLMEPAGPGLFPVGKVSADSRRLLDAGKIDSVVWITGGPQG